MPGAEETLRRFSTAFVSALERGNLKILKVCSFAWGGWGGGERSFPWKIDRLLQSIYMKLLSLSTFNYT